MSLHEPTPEARSPFFEQGVPKQNIQLDLDRPHMEILDLGQTKVWQVMTGVTHADFESLDVEPPFVKVGVGMAVMDEGYFGRSPRADTDGPMEVRELFGHTWSYCASPLGAPELPAGPNGPRKLMVDKHHVLLYREGSEVDFLVLPDGSEYIHVIAGTAPLELPEGWQNRSRTMERERTVHLPTPATVFFFPNGDSYQGPV